jgi:hypothetical protein
MQTGLRLCPIFLKAKPLPAVNAHDSNTIMSMSTINVIYRWPVFKP